MMEQNTQIIHAVPYNMAFELSVYTKLNDDALQIVSKFYHISNLHIISLLN